MTPLLLQGLITTASSMGTSGSPLCLACELPLPTFSNSENGAWEKRLRISRGGSRHLRRALYMPVLVAVHREPHLRGFYERLLSHGKARLQAVVAVMRKLLHALFAMFRSNQPYHGSKLYAIEPMVSRIIQCV